MDQTWTKDKWDYYKNYFTNKKILFRKSFFEIHHSIEK